MKTRKEIKAPRGWRREIHPVPAILFLIKWSFKKFSHATANRKLFRSVNKLRLPLAAGWHGYELPPSHLRSYAAPHSTLQCQPTDRWTVANEFSIFVARSVGLVLSFFYSVLLVLLLCHTKPKHTIFCYDGTIRWTIKEGKGDFCGAATRESIWLRVLKTEDLWSC